MLGTLILDEIIAIYPGDISQLLRVHGVNAPMTTTIVGKAARIKPEFGADLYEVYEKKFSKNENQLSNFGGGGKLNPANFLSAIQTAGQVAGGIKTLTKGSEGAAETVTIVTEEEEPKIFGIKKSFFIGGAILTTLIIAVVIAVVIKNRKG